MGIVKFLSKTKKGEGKMKNLWYWLISFLPRRVKVNSVINKELKRPLKPINLGVGSKIFSKKSKKRNREQKDKK